MKLFSEKLAWHDGLDILLITPCIFIMPGLGDIRRRIMIDKPQMGIIAYHADDRLHYHEIWDNIPSNPMEVFRRFVSSAPEAHAVHRMLSRVWDCHDRDTVYLYGGHVSLEWEDIEPYMMAWRRGKPLTDLIPRDKEITEWPV